MGMDIAMTGIAEIRHHGHTLADLDRDVNAWVAARQKYIASADCGSLAGDACKEHYQIEVVPNLKATELAWAAVQGQLDFMLAHGSVPPPCRAQIAELRTAASKIYSFEEKVVSAVINHPDTVRYMIRAEEAATTRDMRSGSGITQGCRKY
jgi:hypothetical protein